VGRSQRRPGQHAGRHRIGDLGRQRGVAATNSPIAIAGNTIIVPAGGPALTKKGDTGNAQLLAYTVG
jgi:hypothetical protein